MYHPFMQSPSERNLTGSMVKFNIHDEALQTASHVGIHHTVHTYTHTHITPHTHTRLRSRTRPPPPPPQPWRRSLPECGQSLHTKPRPTHTSRTHTHREQCRPQLQRAEAGAAATNGRFVGTGGTAESHTARPSVDPWRRGAALPKPQLSAAQAAAQPRPADNSALDGSGDRHQQDGTLGGGGGFERTPS